MTCDKLEDFSFSFLIEEIKQHAPLLLKIFTTIVTHLDKRKMTSIDGRHDGGIVMALAILLKDRNREMVGMQTVVSLLLFPSRVQKTVGIHRLYQ